MLSDITQSIDPHYFFVCLKVLGVLRTFFQEGSERVWAEPNVLPHHLFCLKTSYPTTVAAEAAEREAEKSLA